MRDIGTEGEHFFGVLCNNVGLTANRSLDKDRYGWDYYVEFPSTQSTIQSIDSSPPPIECKIQVKSTTKKEGKLQIKVSVLHRLVTTHLPAFFIFFEYGDDDRPTSAYLVHIDDDIISRTLKRIRHMEAIGREKELNKSKVSIKYETIHRLPEVSGTALKDKIESFIPKGMSEYTKEKLRLLEQVGYPETPQTMNFTLHAEDGDIRQEYVSMFLGVGNRMKASNITWSTNRFDIDLPDKAMQDFEEGSISISPTPIKGLIFFKDSQYNPPVEFNAEIYLLPPEINELGLRAITNEFELTFHNGTLNFRGNDSSAHKQPILNYRNYIWLLNKLSKDTPINMGVELAGKAHNIGTIQCGSFELANSKYSQYLSVMDKAIKICQLLDVSIDRVQINPDELLHFRTGIEMLYAFLLSKKESFSVHYPIDNDISENDFRNISYLSVSSAIVGNACFVYSWAFIFTSGKVTREKDYFCIIPDDIRLSDIKFSSPEEMTHIDSKNLQHEFRCSLESEGLKVYDYES